MRHGCKGVPVRVKPAMSTGRAPSFGIPSYATTAFLAVGLIRGLAMVSMTHMAPAAPPTAPPKTPTKQATRIVAISAPRPNLFPEGVLTPTIPKPGFPEPFNLGQDSAWGVS